MKKVIKVILAVVLIIYAGLATIAATAFRNERDSLLEKNYELNNQNIELLTEKTDTIFEEVDMIGFQSFANCVSEKNYISKVLEETVVIIVYTDGRSTDEMIGKISDYSFAIQSSLENHTVSTAVILVMSDNNEVMFGFTITKDGEAIPFVGENYPD